MKACGRILVGIGGLDGAREGCQIERLGPDSEGAREACKNERLRPDSSRELGVAGCAGSVQK